MTQESGNKKTRFFEKHLLFYSVLALFMIVGLIFAIDLLVGEVRSTDRQDILQPFYTPPDPLPEGNPGDIIRSEPLDVDIPGGKGFRILYLTEEINGTRRASSGMVFFPDNEPPPGGRPVVAWAHPTVGMAPQYAPSRTENPVGDMSWLNQMIGQGWVVTATDYAGLGTPGVEHYLIGRDETRDVLNSVRAARQIEDSGASNSFALWGHSQGGHAVLFAGLEAPSYAPELNLVAVAAAAPAAELAPLISEQYNSAVGWVIGPQVVVSWPAVYPGLNVDDVMSSFGVKKYEEAAFEGLTAAGLQGKLRIDLKEDFFKMNPMTLHAWYNAAVSETPALAAGYKPVFIAQGLDDEVVIPNTTALLIQKSCGAGADVTTLWMGGTGHIVAAKVSGPAVVFWLQDRFLGKPTNPSCSQIMPVQPAVAPTAP